MVELEEKLEAVGDERDTLVKKLQAASEGSVALEIMVQAAGDEMDTLVTKMQVVSDEKDTLDKKLQAVGDERDTLVKKLQAVSDEGTRSAKCSRQPATKGTSLKILYNRFSCRSTDIRATKTSSRRR